METNAELRRVYFERLGYERVLREARAVQKSQDRYGTLYHIPTVAGAEPLALVAVDNATPEPDGSVKRYVLRVPPTVKTARAAVAWTFDVPVGDYAPGVQT
jgi:hypothetical protein